MGMKRFKIFTVTLIVVIAFALLPSIVQDFMFGWSIGTSQVERHTHDALQIPVRPNSGDIFITWEDVLLDSFLKVSWQNTMTRKPYVVSLLRKRP